MYRKKFLAMLSLLLCVVLLTGCGIMPLGGGVFSGNKGASSGNNDISAAGGLFALEDDPIDYVDEVTMPPEIDYGYLSAEWSDEPYKRNGCTSYPLVLDAPLQQCKGFTVDYEISDVDGRMKDDSKFQIFYRTGDGSWVKGKTFYLDNWYASVEQTISKPVTVTEVAVLCLNSGNFSWSVSMGIRAPRY